MAADPAVAAVLAELTARLDAVRPYNIGFPGATDFDYAPLADLATRYLMNNVGDPYVDGVGANHTKAMEREVVGWVADLMGAPVGDRWGYVTSGATEGTLYALFVARALFPDAVVYFSAAAHHSVEQAVALLGMDAITVVADKHGEVDYTDLADQIDRHRHRAAVVVANIGTTMTEALDDVGAIHDLLDALAVRRRFVHADAALSGIPLALAGHPRRPVVGPRGVDTVVVSGHKFPGCLPSGVVITTASLRNRIRAATAYTGSPNSTVTGSRSALAPLMLWYNIRLHGIDGHRARAETARQLAAYAKHRLHEIGWPAWRHEHAFTVVLRTPASHVLDRWVLVCHGGWSHIITMPGVTRQTVDLFLADLQASPEHTAVAADASTSNAGNAGAPRSHPLPEPAPAAA